MAVGIQYKEALVGLWGIWLPLSMLLGWEVFGCIAGSSEQFHDEIDAMLIGVSLEYNVQKMKKWFIQKGYCVLVGESGIFKRIHFHEILENEEYEVNGEKFNYYVMKPFGNIHQSVRR